MKKNVGRGKNVECLLRVIHSANNFDTVLNNEEAILSKESKYQLKGE